MAGFKVADVYAELHLDRDEIRKSVRNLPRDLDGDIDRAGRDMGERLTRGLQERVENLSGKLQKARLDEKKAADAVALAERKLSEAREDGNVKGSRLLALEQKLAQEKLRLAAASNQAAVAARRHSEAERRLAEDIDSSVRRAMPNADRGGRDLGDKLSMGMHLAIIRNSPLIVAAIAAILAAGAPLMMAAATTLFAGIGIVAAAQSQRVQSAWVGAWQQIKRGAIEDAGVLEPLLVNMASRVARGFEQLRPAFRQAFEASGPLIEKTVDGLFDMANNAMPGLVRAVASSHPVFDGLRSLLADTGTGLSDFFDILADHSPAAGAAFAALGQILRELLPILGELLGQGAELAAAVLPPLARALGVVMDALEAIRPLLPVIAVGFAGMKIAQTATGWITGLAGSLDRFAVKAGLAATGSGRLSTAVSGIGRAMPLIGLATAGLTVALEESLSAQEDFGRSLDALYAKMREGGPAGEQARLALEQLRIAAEKFGDVSLGPLGTDFPEEFAAAAERAREYEASLTPLAQAQEVVRQKSDALGQAIRDHGPNSAEAAAAGRDLADAQREAARAAEEEEAAIRGVTEAMVDQIDTARARVDDAFAYQKALNDVEDAQAAVAEAQAHLNDSNEETRTTAEDVARAQLDLAEAYRDAGQKASDLAMSDLPAAMDDQQKALMGASAELDYYRGLLAQGVDLPPELDEHVAYLERVVAGADAAAISEDALRAKTDELVAQLQGLSKGDMKVALADEATPVVRSVLEQLGILENTKATAKADADISKAQRKILLATGLAAGFAGLNVDATLGAIDEATPVLDGARRAIESFGQTKAEAKAGVNISEAQRALLAATGDVRAFGGLSASATADLNTGPFANSIGGALAQIFNFDKQKPTPTADMNTSPFAGAHASAMARIGALAAQRPTPTAFLSDGPIKSSMNSVFNTLALLNAQRPAPVATLYANTGGAEAALNWAARNRVSYVTQYVTSVKSKWTGGRVDEPIRAAVGRKVFGPGGPTDDLVQAVGPGGEDYRLSAGEWIINALVSRAQGDAMMALLNAGQATIVPTGPDVVSGPPPVPSAAAAPLAPGAAPAAAAGGVTVQGDVVVRVETPLNLMNAADLRRAGLAIRQVIVGLERETR